MLQAKGKNFKLQDLSVEDGREYIRTLMDRKTCYKDHPMHKERDGKLKIKYIHGLGWAIRSFSTWAYTTPTEPSSPRL